MYTGRHILIFFWGGGSSIHVLYINITFIDLVQAKIYAFLPADPRSMGEHMIFWNVH